MYQHWLKFCHVSLGGPRYPSLAAQHWQIAFAEGNEKCQEAKDPTPHVEEVR